MLYGSGCGEVEGDLLASHRHLNRCLIPYSNPKLPLHHLKRRASLVGEEEQQDDEGVRLMMSACVIVLPFLVPFLIHQPHSEALVEKLVFEVVLLRVEELVVPLHVELVVHLHVQARDFLTLA